MDSIHEQPKDIRTKLLEKYGKTLAFSRASEYNNINNAIRATCAWMPKAWGAKLRFAYLGLIRGLCPHPQGRATR